MSRRAQRLSDPGDEPGPSIGARLGVGCGVSLVVLVLLGGALGIGLGAQRRLAGWGDADEAEQDPADPGPPVVAPGDPGGAGGAGPAVPGVDPIAEMRRRYRPGPFVEVESMVPSGRLLPATIPGALPSGRTVDSPWAVMGAELRPAPMPAPSSASAPRIWHARGEPVDRPLTILPRTPARAEVGARDATGGTEVMAYLVDFEGYPGHFHLPAMVQTELGVVSAGGSEGATIYFTIRAPLMSDGRPLQPGQRFGATMRIAAVDAEGQVSSVITRPLTVMAVGAGDVEVTLTMGEATDLDLYVTDPAGVTVYFANRDSFSGGHLDLDANAACSSNVGVDNEHIYWPRHRAPAGTYRVFVAHYESCIAGRPVDYRVTVSACGETVVLSGRYDGTARSDRCLDPKPQDRAWCQEAVAFDIPPCAAQ